MTVPTTAPHTPGWVPEDAWTAVERGEQPSVNAIYQEQRERCPVAWRQVEDQGFWCAFDYDDVVEVLNDPQRFSSATAKYGAPMIPIEIDPPEHAQYRRLLAQLINPGRLKRFEADIRGYIGELLDAAVADGGRSLLEATGKVPLRSFCLLIGEPDQDEWKAISQKREAGNESRLALLDPASIAKRKAAAQPIADYCTRQIERRRAEPGDDLVSDILSGEVDDRPVTDDEALRILTLIYIAGHRTTTAALRGAVVQLARNPEIQARLRSDPSQIPLAIEEILRLETPVHALPRYCTEDTEVGGQAIRKGEQVFPVYGAANMDPKVFPDPEAFDPSRRPVRHVAFGRGIHICAGAPLARLQMKAFIEELLRRTETIALTGPVTRPAWPHYGASDFQVRLDPAR